MDNYLEMAQNYITVYGMKILGAIAILIIGLWVAKLITKSFNKMMVKKGTDATLTKFFTAMVRIALIASISAGLSGFRFGAFTETLFIGFFHSVN